MDEIFAFLGSYLDVGQTALELAMFNGLTVLALFLSYSMLNVCDLSTDGCYTLGAAVGVVTVIELPKLFLGLAEANPDAAGFYNAMASASPYLSIVLAMLAGMVSGLVVAVLQTRMGVQSLLAGIVVNTGLYSINLIITGNRSTVAIMRKTDTVFTLMKDGVKDTFLAEQYKLAVGVIAVVLVAVFLILFMRTKLGLAIHATGSNADMVRSSSINPAFTTTIGLMISNSFTALSGCLFAQQAKSFDISTGSGMVTVALASLLIGGVFTARRSVWVRVIGAIVGTFIFRLVYAIALKMNMPAYMLKAVSAIIVVLAISGPYLVKQLKLLRRRAAANRERGEAYADPQ